MADQCRLCGRDSVLKISHLMPKGLYKGIARTFLPYDSAPVWASRSQRAVYYSNAQVTKKLLCGACEDLFNRNGERYVLQRCMKNAHAFKLKDKLEESKSSIRINGSDYFHPNDLAGLVSSKFLYFAASIAWRANATDWGNKDVANLHGALPVQFVYSIEQHLLEKAAFPNDIYVTVCVDDDVNPTPVMSLPSGNIAETMHMSFFIPGIKFNLFFGSSSDIQVANHFSRLGVNVLYMFRSFAGSPEYQDMKRLLSYEAVPKGKLAEQRGKKQSYN